MRDSSLPSFLIPQDGPLINLTIASTNAFLTNQGYTYNQSGFSFNQAGVSFGGVSAVNQDITPLLSTGVFITPASAFITDLYSPGEVDAMGASIGPGFFMYITENVRTVLF